MSTAEFISLLIITLKTTGSNSMKIHQANLMLVVLSVVLYGAIGLYPNT
jgi:hypothetical protein